MTTSGRRCTSVVGPTETMVIGQSGQSASSRRRSSSVTRLKASSSCFDRDVVVPWYIQWKPSEASRPMGRSLRRTERASTLFLAWISSSSVRPSRISRSVDLGDPAEVVLGRLGLAAQEGEEGAGLVVVLVGDLGAVGKAGIDQRPVEPRAGVVAEDGGQQVGGVTVRALERRPVADADDGLLLVVGPEDGPERAGAVGRHGLPGRAAALPGPAMGPASSTSGSNRALPAKASTMLAGLYRRAKYSRIWSAVMRRDRLDRAQDAVAQRMRAEVGRLGRLVGHRHRVVQVHPDLFDDHLLLGLEVLARGASGRRISERTSKAGGRYSGRQVTW